MPIRIDHGDLDLLGELALQVGQGRRAQQDQSALLASQRFTQLPGMVGRQGGPVPLPEPEAPQQGAPNLAAISQITPDNALSRRSLSALMELEQASPGTAGFVKGRVNQDQIAQQRQQDSQWSALMGIAEQESWTPDQIQQVAQQFQNKQAYKSIPNPVGQTQTAEDESDPVVKISRLKEQYPQVADFLQVNKDGTLEMIPGVVQLQTAIIKAQSDLQKEQLKAQQDGQPDSPASRKAQADEYNLQRDLARDRFNWPRPAPTDDYLDNHTAELAQYKADREGYETTVRELQGKFFGVPQANPTSQPAAPVSNPRLSAAERGIQFVSSPQDIERLKAEGRLTAGQQIMLPDGRVATAK